MMATTTTSGTSVESGHAALGRLTLQMARGSFLSFCKLILKQKVGRMHEEMINSVMHDPRHLVIMAARGHFKTTVMSVAFPLYIAFSESEPPDDILLISSSLEQAHKNIRLLKQAVESNPVLREMLMPSGDEAWKAAELEFKNGWRVRAVAFGDSVRGNHPRYAILDDVLRDESTNIEESKNKFYQIVYPIVQAKRGKIIVVGTPMAYDDLLHELSKKEDVFKFLKFPAFRLDGTPQFPEHFDFSQLEEIRKAVPPSAWSREYMCEPVSGDSMLFPEELVLRACAIKPLPDAKFQMRIVAYDVAVTESEGADYSAYVVLDIYDKGPLIAVEADRFRLTTDKQIEEVKRIVHRWRPDHFVMEKTGVGVGLFQLCANDGMLGGLVREFETKQRSKQEILGLLEGTIRNGALGLPDNKDLVNELTGWEKLRNAQGQQVVRCTRKHDDLSMALAIAVFGAQEYGGVIGAMGVEPILNPGSFSQKSNLNESLISDGSETLSQGADWNSQGSSNSDVFYTYG